MDCRPERLSFRVCRGRRFEACFDGGWVTGNGGPLLLGQADRRLVLAAVVVRRLADPRHWGKRRHGVSALLGQRVRPFYRRDNHRDEAGHHMRQFPILATPAEDLVRVHVVPARHYRHRNTGLVTLRHDPALPRLAPPTATAANPTLAPGTRLLRFVRHPHKCPLILGGHLRRAHFRTRNLPDPRQKPQAAYAGGYVAGGVALNEALVTAGLLADIDGQALRVRLGSFATSPQMKGTLHRVFLKLFVNSCLLSQE